MNELLKVLKQNGWNDELLESIGRISKSIPDNKLGTIPNVPSPKGYDLRSINVSASSVNDSTTLFLHK